MALVTWPSMLLIRATAVLGVGTILVWLLRADGVARVLSRRRSSDKYRLSEKLNL